MIFSVAACGDSSRLLLPVVDRCPPANGHDDRGEYGSKCRSAGEREVKQLYEIGNTA
jgi:hypothetical protein